MTIRFDHQRANLPRRASNALVRELGLFWQFVHGDISATVVPMALLAVGVWHHEGMSPSALASAAARVIVYFALYIYTFCLANQLVGVEEDRLNKPSRPLVTGAVSVRGAWIRWALAMIAYTWLGLRFGVLAWTLVWEAVVILHNFGRISKHWLLKDLCMGTGTVAMMAATWQMIAPIDAVGWRWILCVAAYVFTHVSCQDLRDMRGDRAVGRTTFPLFVGERRARIWYSALFTLSPIAFHFVLFAPAGRAVVTTLCDAGAALIGLVIAARFQLLRTEEADHRTYLLHTYQYCYLLACTIVVI